MKKIQLALIVIAVVLAALIGLLTLRADKSSARKTGAETHADSLTGGKRPQGPKTISANRTALPRGMPKIVSSSPPSPMDEKRRAIVMKFLSETDPEKRRYIVPELVDLNDPQSVFQILELLKTESDPQVRDNLIVFLGYMPYSTNYAEEIIAEARKIHASPVDKGDRLALQRMAIELQHPKSVEFLRDVYQSPQTLPEERINAGEGLVRLHHEVGLVPRDEAAQIVEQMRLDARAIADPVERAQAYRALNVTRFDNRDFFREMLAIETDEDCRNVLSAYAVTDVRPAPTRGPLKTPWPSPTPWTDQTPVPTAVPTGPVKPYVEPTPQIEPEITPLPSPPLAP